MLFASHVVRAESTEIETLNPGLNDAWFNPDTAGQGFFITVFPEIEFVFLAWFTFDTERPAPIPQANLGEAGHRWITAEGNYSGNTAELEIIVTRGGVFDQGAPVPENVAAGSITLTFENCNSGLVSYEFPEQGLSGEIPIQRIAPDNVARCEQMSAPSCTRPEPDRSHGPNDPPVVDGAIIPVNQIVDGGPGPDGIPPISSPIFNGNTEIAPLAPNDLVVGVKYGGHTRAYPHNILNWHEVVNDNLMIDGQAHAFTLNYCPLTGSAMSWKGPAGATDKTFGTSGLLYNSNLVMYDRQTQSLWSQMLEQAINGPMILTIPDRMQVVETTWDTWLAMYPETVVLSRNTGFSRNYDEYPYGNFRTDRSILFPVNNSDDDRLHPKERVLGINVGDSSKVYPIENFSSAVEVINDVVGNMQVVATGSSELNFGVVYNRELADCTVLEFEAVQDQLPVVMRDNEGNEWDVFGNAVSGPRAGQKLQKTNSYIAFWFAWTAFFEGAEIHR